MSAITPEDRELLEDAASNGTFESKRWLSILDRVIEQIHHIIRSDFPPPPPDPSDEIEDEETASSPAHALPNNVDESTSASSPAAKKDADSTSPPQARPPVPSFSSPTRPANEQHGSTTLPPSIQTIIQTIITNLKSNFSDSPPHTLQRLCELLLHPRKHYRTLSTYLRALDRVLSVSSSLTLFPLPAATVTSDSNSQLLNGISPSSQAALGSDESLGGALLSPIPWLRDQQNELRTESTETIDGPNGAGSVETVSITVNNVSSTVAATASQTATPAQQLAESMREAGAVTQGELLRQEQEAGVIPLAQVQPHTPGRQTRSATARSAAASAAAVEKGTGEEDLETPHVRGPEEIGMEDMGPQTPEKVGGRAFDLEAATGRSLTPKEGSGAAEPTDGDKKEDVQMDPGDEEAVEEGTKEVEKASDSV